MTMKQFTTAARRGETQVPNPIDITFEWEVREGEFIEMTAHPPTTGQLALFFAHQNERGTGPIRAMLSLIAQLVSDEDFAIIEDQLAEGLDVQIVVELIQYLTGEWSARPTTSSNGSTRSPRTIGRTSTLTPQRKASTRSTSR